MELTDSRLAEILREELARAKRAGLTLEPTDDVCCFIRGERRFGCNKRKRTPSGEFRRTIHICKSWAEVAPEEEVRTVIAHEIAHSVKGSDGHGGVWQEAVQRLRKLYDYTCADYHLNPHPYSRERRTLEHTDIPSKPQKAKKTYVVVCSKCGHAWVRTRRNNFVKYPHRYTHTGCGGRCMRAQGVKGITLSRRA